MEWKERGRVAECLELEVLFRGKGGVYLALACGTLIHTGSRRSDFAQTSPQAYPQFGCNVDIACSTSRLDPSLALSALSICPGYPGCHPAQYTVTSLQNIRVDPPRCAKEETKSCQTTDASIGREGVERRCCTQHMFRLWGN